MTETFKITETDENSSLAQAAAPLASSGFSWKSAALGFLVWTLLGLSFVSEVYLRHYKADALVAPMWIYVVEVMTNTYIYALFSPLVFRFGKRFPLELKVSLGLFFRNVAVHFIAGLIFAMASLYLGNLIAVAWQGDLCQGCLDLNMLLDPHMLHRGVIIYWGTLIVGVGIEYFRGFNNEKLRVAELSSRLSDAQLSALKMQIHPHFLFNTLNSIVGLISEDQRAAELMTTRLSDFLRMTLHNSGAPIVTLKEEFYFLQTYLDIEKVRFESRLAIEFEIDEELLDAQIPNLILQPLVENSIKHGISRKKTGGKIKVSAARAADRLILKVEDSGEFSDVKQISFHTPKSGLGLKNTAARLRQIYGERFSFEIKKMEDKTIAAIEIPFEI